MVVRNISNKKMEDFPSKACFGIWISFLKVIDVVEECLQYNDDSIYVKQEVAFVLQWLKNFLEDPATTKKSIEKNPYF